MNNLANRVAIVTGATSGIGRAVIEELALNGAHVVAVGRNAGRLAEVEASLTPHGNVLTLQLDVRSESDMAEMAARVLDRYGRIDILVASAGIARAGDRVTPAPLVQLPASEWQEILSTNLRGVFLSNRAVLPAMIAQRGGDILNISSYPAGMKGQPFAAAYSASKFGVIGLSESLLEEVRSYGIRVQTLLPGPTETPIFGESGSRRFGPLMPVKSVAEAVVYMLNLPFDSTLESVVVTRVD